MKLKPCPFCGANEHSAGRPAVITETLMGPDGSALDYAVRCQRCGAQTDWYPDEKEDAVEAWNRRAGEGEKRMKDKKKTLIVNDELGEMFCYSLRYALGRMSYAPASVINYLRPLLPYIGDTELYIWKRDIMERFPSEEEVLLDPAMIGASEALYFRELWMNFLDNIRKEEERRKGQ